MTTRPTQEQFDAMNDEQFSDFWDDLEDELRANSDSRPRDFDDLRQEREAAWAIRLDESRF